MSQSISIQKMVGTKTMNKTYIEIYFLIIASILYAARYISGAMGAIGATEWSKEEFANYLSYVPDGLMIATIISKINKLTINDCIDFLMRSTQNIFGCKSN